MMNQQSNITVRIATHSDVEKILQISEGIYNGADYIPLVIREWLSEPRRFIFVEEYEGEIIGMLVATIKSDGKSFVTQALRIHPKHRGRGLSYPFTAAATFEICAKFPQISKNIISIVKHEASHRINTKKGYALIAERFFYNMQNIRPCELANIRHDILKARNLKLVVPLSEKDVLALLQDKNVLNLVGSHGFVLGKYNYPYKLPGEAHLLAGEIATTGEMLVDQATDGFPKSLSYGILSKGVTANLWNCYSYTKEADVFKRHVLNHLKGATELDFDGPQEFVEIQFYQSGESTFDGERIIKDELSRLKVVWEVTRGGDLLMEEDLT